MVIDTDCVESKDGDYLIQLLYTWGCNYCAEMSSSGQLAVTFPNCLNEPRDTKPN